MQAQHKYQDKKLFLIGIAFISAFNYYLTYNNIRFNWFLVITYTLDTIQGWLAWWSVRSIIIYLDKVMPYTDRPLKRIGLQLLVTTISGLLIIIVLTEIVSLVARGRTAPADFYLFDIFIIVIWFLVINGIYIGMHYFYEWKHSELQRMEDKKVRSTGFTVKNGKQNLLIPFHDIFAFYTESGYSVLLTRINKKYLTDRSLDKIEETLPKEFFFRLNRQYIVHREGLTGFKRLEDGKIEVLVNAPENFPLAIPISRLKAVSFKSWFETA